MAVVVTQIFPCVAALSWIIIEGSVGLLGAICIGLVASIIAYIFATIIKFKFNTMMPLMLLVFTV